MRALPDIYKAELTGWNEWQRGWVKNENNGKFEIQASFHFASIIDVQSICICINICINLCNYLCTVSIIYHVLLCNLVYKFPLDDLRLNRQEERKKDYASRRET